MGYYSQLTGRIDIDPPLTWAEVLSTGHDPDTAQSKDLCVVIDLDVTITETDEGAITTKHGTSIVPVTDEPQKFYDLSVEMTKLCKHPVFQGRTLTGHIMRVGEDQGDVERYDSTGQAEAASLIWPDGSSVEW